jgi:hypothetical protein
MQSFAALLLVFLASAAAFSFNSRLNVPCLNRVQGMSSRSQLSMSDDDKFEPEFQPEDPKLFDMNRIVRLGRSRDQVMIFSFPMASNMLCQYVIDSVVFHI